MFARIRKDERGFGYVDILVAVTILLLVTMSLTSLFVHEFKSIQSNVEKTTAKEIVAQEMEKIKSLSYDDIGMLHGNPEGILEPSKTIEKDNRQFQLETRVKWEDDPSDEIFPQDSDPRDYKKVAITVSWDGIHNNQSYKLTNFFARESQPPLPAGGNIVALVNHYPDNAPAENVKVNLLSGPFTPKYDYTNENGQIIFPLIAEGTYEAGIDSPMGYSGTPESQETTIGVGNTEYVQFYIARSSSLTVRLVDPSDNLIDKHSRLALSHPLGIEITAEESNGEFQFDDLFPGIWVVDEAWAASYEPTSGDTIEVESGESNIFKIVLTPRPPANIHLTVYDNITGDPIDNAAISLTNVETSENITGTTNTQGIYENSMDAGTYELIVSKDGYETYSNTMTLPPSENTVLDVFLEPEAQVGAIRVRTERRWNHAPRNNISIRVIGTNGYDHIQQTGDYAPGETLFTDLEPGAYDVSLKWGSSWIAHRNVQVNADETAYVLYSW